MVAEKVFTINVQEAQSEIKSQGKSDNVRRAPTSLDAIQELTLNNEGEEKFEQKRTDITASRVSYWNIFHIITTYNFLSPALERRTYHSICRNIDILRETHAQLCCFYKG